MVCQRDLRLLGTPSGSIFTACGAFMHTLDIASHSPQETAEAPGLPVVYIIDDDGSSRELLSAFLRPTGLRVLKYASATEFLEQFQDDLKTPRCLVLDVCMEMVGGIELQRRLNSHGIRLPIVFVSGSSGVPEAVSVMKNGAIDFLQKPIARERFLECVLNAIALDTDEKKRLALQRAVNDRQATLTPRERDVMNLLVGGFETKQIASQLAISPKTVFVHRARVLQKMNVENLVELHRLITGNLSKT